MHWSIHLEGGPKRVNHAAAAVHNKIYSFGGYCSGERCDPDGVIDVHVLHTDTYRWKRLWTVNERELLLKKRAGRYAADQHPTLQSKLSTSSGISVGSINSLDSDEETAASSTFLFSSNPMYIEDEMMFAAESSAGDRLGETLSQDRLCANSRRPAAAPLLMTSARRRAHSVVDDLGGDGDAHPLRLLHNLRPPMEDVARRRTVTAVDEMVSTSERQAEDQRRRVNESHFFYNQLEHDLNVVANMDATEAERRSDSTISLGIDEDSVMSDGDDGVLSVYDDFDFNIQNNNRISRRRRSQYADEMLEALNAAAGGAGANEIVDELMDMDDDEEDEDDAFGNVEAPEWPHADVPYRRYGHTVVAYDGRIYLWGGRNDKYGSSNVLYEFDPVTLTWTSVKCNGAVMPPARDGHTAVVHGDQMYVFGGFEETMNQFSQETYAFDFRTRAWQLLRTRGEPPRHRDFHTACVLDDGRMYVFGGRSNGGGPAPNATSAFPDCYSDELNCLCLSTLQWSVVRADGDRPCGRRSHSVWSHNGYMYLFGGYSGEGNRHFADLYRFCPREACWTQCRPGGNVRRQPAGRRRQCTVCVGDRVFLFGGTMPASTATTANGTVTTPCSKTLVDLSDLYVLDHSPSLATLCAEAINDATVITMTGNVQQQRQWRQWCERNLPVMLSRQLHYMRVDNYVGQAPVVTKTLHR